MKLFWFVFLFYPFIVLSQIIDVPAEDIKKMEFEGIYKSSISLELGGKSGLVGVSYDLLLSPRWRFGVGGGYSGAGIDLKFYPGKVQRNKIIFNLGARANIFQLPNDYVFYSLPLGLTYFSDFRMNFDFDIGPLYKQTLNDNLSPGSFWNDWNYVWISAKVSYRFSFYAMNRWRKTKKML